MVKKNKAYYKIIKSSTVRYEKTSNNLKYCNENSELMRKFSYSVQHPKDFPENKERLWNEDVLVKKAVKDKKIASFDFEEYIKF